MRSASIFLAFKGNQQEVLFDIDIAFFNKIDDMSKNIHVLAEGTISRDL